MATAYNKVIDDNKKLGALDVKERLPNRPTFAANLDGKTYAGPFLKGIEVSTSASTTFGSEKAKDTNYAFPKTGMGVPPAKANTPS